MACITSEHTNCHAEVFSCPTPQLWIESRLCTCIWFARLANVVSPSSALLPTGARLEEQSVVHLMQRMCDLMPRPKGLKTIKFSLPRDFVRLRYVDI